MIPISFPEQTIVIAKDQPEYQPLPAFVFANDPSGRIVCCWKLTWRERLKLLFTGKIWHQIMRFGQPLQPQLLQLAKPFSRGDVHATESRRVFIEELLRKYGTDIDRRAQECDLRGYHPNDRRRSIVIDPADFTRCRDLQIFFLNGLRLTDEHHNSPVK